MSKKHIPRKGCTCEAWSEDECACGAAGGLGSRQKGRWAMSEDAKLFLAVAALVLAACVIGGGNWVFRSYMEAQAFNAVTGKNVSTWNAMWVELRVQEQGKGNEND